MSTIRRLRTHCLGWSMSAASIFLKQFSLWYLNLSQSKHIRTGLTSSITVRICLSKIPIMLIIFFLSASSHFNFDNSNYTEPNAWLLIKLCGPSRYELYDCMMSLVLLTWLTRGAQDSSGTGQFCHAAHIYVLCQHQQVDKLRINWQKYNWVVSSCYITVTHV